jgi:hypothetical protein
MLKDKRFRYGTFSTVMMIFAVVIFVLANLLAGEFNRTRDLTSEQIFSLTEQSKNFLENLEQDVTITLIAGTQELPGILAQVSRVTNRLLEEYATFSRVRVETRDPMLNPAFVHNLADAAGIVGGIPTHSVVVQSGDEIRVIQPHEMVDINFNPRTGEITQITSYNLEREITRAIHMTTTATAFTIYFVTGSGENPLPPQFVNFLQAENFEIREINLVIEEIPDDAEILFIPPPARDWTETKAARVLNFLEAEGNAFFALDATHVPMPNLANVLDAYGLSLAQRLIVENNPQNIFEGRSFYIIPSLAQHEITENLYVRHFANLFPFFPAEIEIQDVRRTTLDIQPLFLTSRESFSRGLDSDAESLARVASDTNGPFALAVAVTDRIFLDGTAFYTRIVAINSIEFLDPYFNMYIGEGNWYFALNSLRWMQDQAHGVFVPARVPPGQMPLLITDRTANILGVISIGALPLICICIGVFVWLRRRNA